MIDTTSPYLPYIIASYGIAFVLLPAMLIIQRRQWRKVQEQLTLLRETHHET